MTTKQFFKNLKEANKFKQLISEGAYRVDIITDESVYKRNLGTVSTYEKFKEIIQDNFHPDAALKIINGEVETTAYRRTFKVYYTFNSEEFYLELFVD